MLPETHADLASRLRNDEIVAALATLDLIAHPDFAGDAKAAAFETMTAIRASRPKPTEPEAEPAAEG